MLRGEQQYQGNAGHVLYVAVDVLGPRGLGVEYFALFADWREQGGEGVREGLGGLEWSEEFRCGEWGGAVRIGRLGWEGSQGHGVDCSWD